MTEKPSQSDALPSDEEKRLYVAEWKRILFELLGWSEEQVLRWVDETRDGFLDNPLLGHETSAFYVTTLLMPDTVRNNPINHEFHLLTSRLEHAINQSFPPRPLNENYDWPAVRVRINAILAEYGTELPKKR